MRKGCNPHLRCESCGVRHRPDSSCSTWDGSQRTESASARREPEGAPGAGDGTYHRAGFLKKYGA